MSVIVRVLNKDCFELYSKGSPEKIAEMSRPESCKFTFYNDKTANRHYYRLYES